MLDNINKIIITNDFLRVYDQQENVFDTPFKHNTLWLKNLVGDVVADILELPIVYFWGDEDGAKSIRWKIYSSLNLPFSIESWSKIYETVDINESNLNDINVIFKSALVLTYESSPSLLKIYNQLNIPYIDFSIHPVRFLKDYPLALRSNIPSIQKKIKRLKLNDQVCKDQARLYRAKASRIKAFDGVLNGSVIFSGQMGQDSSLIQNKCMFSKDNIIFNLERLSSTYSRVYYKKHPHFKDNDFIEKIVKKIKKIEVVDWNAYDMLASGKFSKLVAISSGLLMEAKYFNIDIERISSARNYYDTESIEDELTYYGIIKAPLTYDFWQHIFYDTDFDTVSYDVFDKAVQQTLNVNWAGRLV